MDCIQLFNNHIELWIQGHILRLTMLQNFNLKMAIKMCFCWALESKLMDGFSVCMPMIMSLSFHRVHKVSLPLSYILRDKKRFTPFWGTPEVQDHILSCKVFSAAFTGFICIESILSIYRLIKQNTGGGNQQQMHLKTFANNCSGF